MRRRSGALYSDSEENYIDIAVKCQKSTNLFSSSFGEEEDDMEIPDRRSHSSELNNFDFNGDNSIYPSSFPPKTSDLLIDSPGKTYIPKTVSLSNASLEIEENNTRIAKIMVLGEILTGRKTFINSLFPIKTKDKGSNGIKNTYQNYCLDLIVHSLTTKENEKIVYKCWIQNLSNEKFDNIISIYYKSTDLFVLLFDAEKPEALEKLQKCFQDIQKTKVGLEMRTILVAMHNKKKEIDVSKALKFVHENKIKDFFKVYREDKCNIAILEKMTEIILPGIRVKGKFK